MNYPSRDINHIKESTSLKILFEHLPNEWIIREMTERDYGIDLYIEIVTDNRITGDLLAIQIKGKNKVKFDKSRKCIYSGIKKTTINYWLGLPVPVFFVVVDLDAKIPYFVSVREQNRKGRFIKDSKTVSLILSQDFKIINSEANLFKLMYLREKRWPDVETAMEKALMSFTSFGPFILMCRRKPENETCSATMQYLLLEHYNNFYLIGRYLNICKPKTIDEWYRKHLELLDANNLESNSLLRFKYKYINEIIDYFAYDYREAIRVANLLVIKTQKEYYKKRFKSLYLHLKERPLAFIYTDWDARYYYDEYENETQNIEELFFEDFEEYDNCNLADGLNT